MELASVKEYCLKLPGSTENESGEPSNVLSYKVGDKLFAYFKTSNPEKWRFSIRTTPDRFVELTDYPGIKPARYMQRFHWVTIVKVSSFDSDYLIELIDWSYNRAFSSLSKKRQNEITLGLNV